MGLPVPMARIILEEHKYKPITGDICLCGRQTTGLKREKAVSFIQEQGVAVRSGVEPKADEDTTSKENDRLSDASFFDLFADVSFNAIDVTDYEGANLIHDMAQPIEPELTNRFDFIYNGSCMDNMSNPGQFLANTTEMLRTGGRIVHLEHGTPTASAYIVYSPDFFFDYYVANEFADCKVYIALFQGDAMPGPWSVFQWDPLYVRDGIVRHYMASSISTREHFFIITIAEKAADSTSDVYPIQSMYRPTKLQKPYVETALRFRRSPRPILDAGSYLPFEAHNFRVFCGSF